MLSFENGSKAESDILLTLIKGAEEIRVTPLVRNGLQVGLRYKVNNSITLDAWKPTGRKINGGIKVKYTKCKNGLTSHDERNSKEFYLDITHMQNVLNLLGGNKDV